MAALDKGENGGSYESPDPTGRGKAASTNSALKAFLEAGKSLIDEYGGEAKPNYDNVPGKGTASTSPPSSARG